MRLKSIFLLFLIFRIIDLGIIYLSQRIIPYLGFFPYKGVIDQYRLPQVFSSLANFDGAHYLLIAKDGYGQYQQAFFPLYPLLIRLLSPLFFNNALLAAIVISNAAFLCGLLVFNKYLEELQIDSKKRNWTLFLLLAFPASFFFGAVYTEGLFFFLFISSLYFLKKENYVFASLFGLLSTLTRLVGVFLIVPFFLQFLRQKKSERRNPRLLFLLLAPLLGFLVYSLFLLRTTGDPLFFLNAQWAFGANRSSNLILLPQVYFRYFKIFLTAAPNFQYFISLLEFTVFTLVFVVLVFEFIQLRKTSFRNFALLGLLLFSFANLLLPTFTGTFSSIPRYSLFSFSFFLALSRINHTPFKIFIAAIFFLFHIILLGFFTQGYFVS